MADNIAQLNESISKLNKNLQYLTGANLFNNARMNEMVEASGKIKDNFDDISDISNDIIKKSKEEEIKLKAINDLERKRINIKKLEREIEEKTNKIKKNGLEIAERNRKIANKVNKEESERTEDLKKQTLILSDQRKELKLQLSEAKANLKTSEEQTKEYEKQLELQKEQVTIGKAFGNDLKRLGGNIKNLASGVVGKFLSAGMFIEGWKNLYEMSNKVYDSYWSLSVPLQKANTGMWALKDKTEEYSKALREVKFTAAKFGYDIDKIAPMMDTLQSKVKYLKKDSEGLWEWDIEGLADDAKQIVSISKMMNMESDEMITMLEERVRRFGDTNKQALNSMNSMAAATLTFNEIMGQGSVFTEEVGKHLMELHQNTKYWTQDFGMLNTMFNSHVALLLKQGKHQKEALAIARQFQESLQQPPDLIKWKAGSKILADFNKTIKGKTDEEAISAVMEKYGVGEGEARTAVEAIRRGHNTQFTQANILQEMLGGTQRGMNATIDAWASFKNFDSSVLKDMGLASSVADAEKIKQLYKQISSDSRLRGKSVEEAIDALVDMEGGSEERRKELKDLFGRNLNEAGKEPESAFENSILKTMKDLKAWLDTPMVQIAAGGVAGGAGIFKDTISNIFSMVASSLIVSKGGAMFKAAGGKLKGIGAGGWKTIMSTPSENLTRFKGYLASEKSGLKIPTSVREFGGAIKETASTGAKAGYRGLGKFVRSSGGGLLAMGIGAGAGLLVNENDKREGFTINSTAQIVSGLADIASRLNPFGLGISTLIGAVQGGFSEESSAIGGVMDSFLSPLDSIVEGTQKMVGKTSTLGKALGYIGESIQESRRWWTNSKTPEQLQSEAMEREAKFAGMNKKLLEKSNAEYDAKYKSILSKYGLEGKNINSSNIDAILKEMNNPDYLYNLALSGESTTGVENMIAQLSALREKQKAIQGAMEVSDIESFAKMSKGERRAAAESYKGISLSRYGGERGTLKGIETFAQSKGWSSEQLQGVKEVIRQNAQLMGGGKDAMLQAENMMLGKLEESGDLYKEMLQKEKEAVEEAKRQAGGVDTLVKNSKEQTTYLSLLSQKAALDIMKDKEDYVEASKKFKDSNGKIISNPFGDIVIPRNVIAGSQAGVSVTQ